MHPARIAELLEPFFGPADHRRPTTDDLESISTYIDLLLRWNARINLTAVGDPEQIVTRHFGESLFAARRLFPSSTHVGTAALGCPAERSSAAVRARQEDRKGHGFSRADMTTSSGGALAPGGKPQDLKPNAQHRPTVADLGSGAGFPGLPIKLWVPDISLTLIESNHKKAAFLREVTRSLTLTDVNILTARAEAITASFAVVTLRAVERFAAVLPIAARLVAPGGRLALLIGSAQFDQARSSLPYVSWSDPQAIPLADSRVLAVAHRASE